jgi:hypothetical protein
LAAYLNENGISRSRTLYKGYGETRRVEMEVVRMRGGAEDRFENNFPVFARIL